MSGGLDIVPEFTSVTSLQDYPYLDGCPAEKSELGFLLAHLMFHINQYNKRELVASNPQQIQ